MQPQSAKKIKKVVFFGTGGTISGLSDDPNDTLNYTAGGVGIAELASQVRMGSSANDFVSVFEQIAQIDSKDLQFPIWTQLIERIKYWAHDPAVCGFLITHGTDTIEETAFFLAVMTAFEKNHDIPTIALTCAMLPASSTNADGPQNIKDAVGLLIDDAWTKSGVVVVCAGEVHRGEFVQKIYTDRLNAFSSLPYESLATIKDGISLNKKPLLQAKSNSFNHVSNELRFDFDCPSIDDLLNHKEWPRVDIIHNYVNSSGDMIHALLNYQSPSSGSLRGLVLAGTGMGTASESVTKALKSAQSAGVLIWQSSRCAFAVLNVRDDLNFYDFHGLTPVKARIALTLHLIANKG